MGELEAVIQLIRDTKHAHPAADKAHIERVVIDRFRPRRRRSLLIGDGYAMRFSQTAGAAFSNTVLSLSALRGVDTRPVVVCVVAPGSVRFLLANSSFLVRISHSSIHLRVDNVKGSFNGTDIATAHDGLTNEPRNFPTLFQLHSANSWEENLERLVEATAAIGARNSRFEPTQEQRATILAAPERAAALIASPSFGELVHELRTLVREQETGIMDAASIQNVNLRGNVVERIITGRASNHGLGDFQRDVDGAVLVMDIKSNVVGRASAPKSYNIDKMLRLAATEGSVFAFLIVRIDVQGHRVDCGLVPVLEDSVRAATRIQPLWSGRGSRGSTQLTRPLDQLLASARVPTIDIPQAQSFMRDLLVT
jgi:hypothetical protein